MPSCSLSLSLSSSDQFQAISEAKEVYFSQPAQSGTLESVDNAPVGSLVWLRAQIRGGEIVDPETGVQSQQAAKLIRDVEMYQYKPISDSERRQSLETNTPPTLSTVWSSNAYGPISTLGLNMPMLTVQNPTQVELKASNFFPAGSHEQIFVDKFELDDYLASQIHDTKRVQLQSDNNFQHVYHPSERFPRYFLQSDGNYLYLRRITVDRLANNAPRYDEYGRYIPPLTQTDLDQGPPLHPSTPLILRSLEPVIGDHRISYTFIPPYPVSLLAVKSSPTTLSVYRSPRTHTALPMLYTRSKATPNEIFAKYQSGATYSIFGWTIAAWVVCFIGAILALGPIFGILSLIPVVGTAFATLGALAAVPAAFFFSLIVLALGSIPLAIILYGPVHALGLAGLAVALIGFAMTMKRDRQDAKDH